MSSKKPGDAAPPLHGTRGRTTLTPSAAVTASPHEDGMVLFDAIAGRLFSANRVGADVWRGVARGLDREAIAQEIAGGYGVAYATALADSDRFLRELTRYGLVAETAR